MTLHLRTCQKPVRRLRSEKNIKEILQTTNYNRRELYVMYVRFKALCALSPTPDGIDEQTFKKGVARLSVEDDLFVGMQPPALPPALVLLHRRHRCSVCHSGRVFKLVDEDGSGCIEWDEFLEVPSYSFILLPLYPYLSLISSRR